MRVTARWIRVANERARLRLTKYAPLPTRRRLRSLTLIDSSLYPLRRIDRAVMGRFITIMVGHFPDERSGGPLAVTRTTAVGDFQKRRVSIPLLILRLKNRHRRVLRVSRNGTGILTDVGYRIMRFVCCSKKESIDIPFFGRSRDKEIPTGKNIFPSAIRFTFAVR